MTNRHCLQSFAAQYEETEAILIWKLCNVSVVDLLLLCKVNIIRLGLDAIKRLCRRPPVSQYEKT